MLSSDSPNPIDSPPEPQNGAVSKPSPETDVSGPVRIVIQVSEDKLKAWISIHPSAQVTAGLLDAEFVTGHWREMGLDPEALAHATAKGFADDWNATHAVVAERLAAEAANPPVPGENARIDFIVDPTMKFKPVEEGGSVDFHNVNLIKPVKKGQPLAKRIPAGLGIHGIDLFGNPVPAPDGEDVELPMGLNTELSKTDPNMVIAAVSGFLQRKDGLLSVNECFVVDGSVDYSTGNIAYEQSAIIRGDIADGFTVNVGGALEVGGAVGEARMMVGGDVLIKKGFVGAGHGLITAKGGVNLGFCSNQTLRAHGDVVVEKEAFNCQIYSRKGISIYGPLVGGLTMAFREITCRVAGNDLGTKTELEVGMDYILHENKVLLEEKLKEMTAHLGKINQKLTRFREVYRTRKRFTSTEAKMMLELRDMQEKIQFHLPDLERRRLDILEQIRQGFLREGLCVKVEKKVNPGVVIKVGTEIFRVQEEMSGPKVFLLQQGRMKVI
ncbi:MAG: FapA family protein [Fibrobacterota bacterium]|nr:FapA family protein [Fibrobacterota bacterium]